VTRVRDDRLAISSHPGGGTTVRAGVLTRDYDAHLEGDD
jgi:hypothetical protein